MIKKLANKFEGKFECLGENTKKHKTFSVPTEKDISKINKDDNESVRLISCKITFIASERFTTSQLSNFVDSLIEGIYKIKCKDCYCFLEYESIKDTFIEYKSFSCNKNYLKKLMKN